MITAFQQLKQALLAGFGLSRDAMHIHIGLVIYFAFHFLLRRKPGDILPLAVLLGVCLVGEILDTINIGRVGVGPLWLESGQDIWNTMFWPALFTIYARWGPKRTRP